MGLFRQWLVEARLPIKGDYKVLPGFKFGIEIEGLLPANQDINQFGRDVGARGLVLDSDGSVGREATSERQKYHPLGFEITTPGSGIDSSDIENQLSLLKILEDYSFYLNSSAGVHIHVSQKDSDPKNLTLSTLINIISLLDEPGIYKALQHREDIAYAKSARKSLARIIRDPVVLEDPQLLAKELSRFAKESTINFMSLFYYGTVEFRLFGATGLINIEEHVGKPLRYLSNLFKKASTEPYEKKGLFIGGNTVITKDKKVEVNFMKGASSMALFHPRAEMFDDVLDRYNMEEEISPEDLEKALQRVGDSRTVLLTFIKLISLRRMSLPASPSITKFWDLCLRFNLLDDLSFRSAKTSNPGEMKGLVKDWAGEKLSRAPLLLRFLHRRAVEGLIDDFKFNMLKGLLDKPGVWPEKSLGDLWDLGKRFLREGDVSRGLSGGPSDGPPRGDLAKMVRMIVDILRQNDRNDLANGLLKKIYKKVYPNENV